MIDKENNKDRITLENVFSIAHQDEKKQIIDEDDQTSQLEKSEEDKIEQPKTELLEIELVKPALNEESCEVNDTKD